MALGGNPLDFHPGFVCFLDISCREKLRCHLHEERDALKPLGDPDFFLISS